MDSVSSESAHVQAKVNAEPVRESPAIGILKHLIAEPANYPENDHKASSSLTAGKLWSVLITDDAGHRK